MFASVYGFEKIKKTIASFEQDVESIMKAKSIQDNETIEDILASHYDKRAQCASDGETSLDCGSTEVIYQSCCSGLVCHKVQTWKCVRGKSLFMNSIKR